MGPPAFSWARGGSEMRRSRPALLLLPRDPASCCKAKVGIRDSRGWGIAAVSPPQHPQQVPSVPWLAPAPREGFIHQGISCVQALEGQLEGWEGLEAAPGGPSGKGGAEAGAELRARHPLPAWRFMAALFSGAINHPGRSDTAGGNPAGL